MDHFLQGPDFPQAGIIRAPAHPNPPTHSHLIPNLQILTSSTSTRTRIRTTDNDNLIPTTPNKNRFSLLYFDPGHNIVSIFERNKLYHPSLNLTFMSYSHFLPPAQLFMSLPSLTRDSTDSPRSNSALISVDLGLT